MNMEAIREWLNRQPFQPFVLPSPMARCTRFGIPKTWR